jgi:hypothetical protein
MPDIRTYRCRFSPIRVGTTHGEVSEYLVPVSWWSYADDRLDARCPAEKTTAQVIVKAYCPKEAHLLVDREFGDYGRVGQPVIMPQA